ncbi:hypothetical protein [Ruegeria lacuscaerulensis]|uniref:hypothetical protein n=1 Tax=Ruegeria lacuscaerulensis TaxID=55218 RepID=UPI001480076F|nr:hypothetical protein [Ruegeria lacuscaerulensis]
MLALGRDDSISLGDPHRVVFLTVLSPVALPKSVSAAPVGPVAFLRVLVASAVNAIAPSPIDSVQLPIRAPTARGFWSRAVDHGAAYAYNHTADSYIDNAGSLLFPTSILLGEHLTVEVHEVSYRNGDASTLNEISLTIPSGGTTALANPNGATTFTII